MLRLKAFPWQSATTTQLLAGQMAHGMNGTSTDGGSLHGEELHPQTDCKDEGGLAWASQTKGGKRKNSGGWTALGLLGQESSLYPVSIMAQFVITAI